MPTLEEDLRDALEGVNDGYNRAVADLNAQIGELANAVGSVTNGQATVALKSGVDYPDKTQFKLSLTAGSLGEQHLMDITIPRSGYPILIWNKQVKNITELRTEIQSLVKADSSLIVYLAYLLRKQGGKIPA